MKQLLQSEFNKGGKIYKNISSPETSGTQTQVTNIILSNNLLKLSTDNGATFIDVATQQGNSNKSDIENLANNNINIKNANSGFSAGNGATAANGGAIGSGATATDGGAIGSGATATTGGAIGFLATATYGGAIGNEATAANGGAIGAYATAGDGFSGGHNAQVGKDSNEKYIDAIQLGTGTNNTPKTLQVYTHKVYDSTKDSLYCSYLNDKTPAVIETVWSGDLKNDGSDTIITVSNYSQYDYFILYGDTYGRYCNIIANINGIYTFVKHSEVNFQLLAYSFSYSNGSFKWDKALCYYYKDNHFNFIDNTVTSLYDLYKIEGVKICKA